MKLRYHHVTIKVRSEIMPYSYWKYLTDNLNIVFAAYGIKREGPHEPHIFYMLYEDDAYLRSYTYYLEKNKSKIAVYREEHDMSEANLHIVKETYEKITPRFFIVNNIWKYATPNK